MPPLVSIILCGHNQGEYLEAAMRSALDQTYPQFEVVALDQGSIDGSPAILRRFAGDPRVRLVLHGDNERLSQRLNEAIALSRGEYVSLLWADDFYLPRKLERQVAAFAGLEREVGVVYSPGYRLNVETGERWLDPSASRSGHLFPHLLESGARINPIAPLIRRECFQRYPYHPDLFGEWEAVFLRFALTYRFHYLPEPLVVMRDHAGNTGKTMVAHVERAMILLDRLLREPEFPPDCRPAVDACRARILRRGAWRVVRHGSDMAWARGAFRRAIRAGRRQALHRKTVAGLALSYLPAGLREVFNRAADGCRRQRVTTRYLAESGVALREYERSAGGVEEERRAA